MDKSKKIKILSAASIVGAVLAITVAFALMTRSMVINGSGNVKPALWDIHFKDISSPTITGGASVITSPTVADKGAKIDNLEVRLSLPQDKIEYTVYIENSGDMNAKIDDIKYPTLTEEESKIFKFSAKYEKDGTPMQVGDRLKIGERKKVIITIEYLDISDKNLLPKEIKTIDIDFKIKYVQDNNSYADEGNQSLLPDGYKECKYLESTGTQYIDTNIYGTENTYVDIDASYYISSSIVGHGRIFGNRSRIGVRSFLIGSQTGKVFISDTYFGHVDGAGYEDTSNMPTTEYKKTNFKLNKTGLRVDNVYVRSFRNTSSFRTPDTLLIFGYINSDSETKNNAVMGIVRVYKCKVYENNELIRNFIPALDNNNNPCMYDTVSGVTFYNQGTGEFNYKLK